MVSALKADEVFVFGSNLAGMHGGGAGECVPAGDIGYLFTDISETGLDSRTFCASLLEKEHVAITPGLSFGDAFDGYIRLAFTLEEDVIRDGIGRIRHFLENL